MKYYLYKNFEIDGEKIDIIIVDNLGIESAYEIIDYVNNKIYCDEAELEIDDYIVNLKDLIKNSLECEENEIVFC